MKNSDFLKKNWENWQFSQVMFQRTYTFERKGDYGELGPWPRLAWEEAPCPACSSQLGGKGSFCNTWGRHHGRAQQKKAAGLYLSPHVERLHWHLLGLARIPEFVARYESPVPFDTDCRRLSRSLCTGLATLARKGWCRRLRACAHSCQSCTQERYEYINIGMNILISMRALRTC